MVKIISSPSIIKAAGNKPKVIEEFIGIVNSSDLKISIARMKSPYGWEEPGQTPEFDEYTFVLSGILRAETKSESYEVKSGEVVMASAREWVRYSSPYPEGAEYIAICLPAFSPDTVHRDE